MKKFAMSAVFVVCAAAAAVGAHAEGKFVARVNGDGITQSDFDRSWRYFLKRSGIPEDHVDKTGKLAEFRTEVLDRLIDEELLYQDAVGARILPEPAALDAEVAEVRGQFESEEQFRESLAGNGLTEDRLRDLFTRRLAIEGLVDQKINAGLSVSDAEVHDFYTGNPDKFALPEQVRARHILFGVEDTAEQKVKDEVRAKADALLEKLRGGSEFETLARESSDCPSSAEGGDLGFFGREQMVPAFAEAAFALQPGELSGVVETRFGFHVIRVEERRDAGAVPESEVADNIREFLLSQKTGEAVGARVKSLREKAVIEILMGL